MAEINVTPLVDVMLVLLIVFMVTAPLLTVGVAVDLPQDPELAAARPGRAAQRHGRPATADLPAGQRARRSTSSGRGCVAITERKPDARIFVRGDKAIDYGRVMEVVGAIHAAGFGKVALVTELDRRGPVSAAPPAMPAGAARRRDR